MCYHLGAIIRNAKALSSKSGSKYKHFRSKKTEHKNNSLPLSSLSFSKTQASELRLR